MPNLTLAISEELQDKMKQYSEIRWSEVVRKTISEKIKTLELLDQLTKKSRLTQKDVEEISHKVKNEIFEEINQAK